MIKMKSQAKNKTFNKTAQLGVKQDFMQLSS